MLGENTLTSQREEFFLREPQTMKSNSILFAAALTLSAASLASAQISESRATLALTFEYEAPGLRERNSSGAYVSPVKTETENSWSVDKSRPSESKVDITEYFEAKQDAIKTRYGNKELLLDLVEEGVITSIAGWYISVDFDEQGLPVSIWALNQMGGAIQLDPDFIGFGETPQVVTQVTYNEKIQTFSSPTKPEKITPTHSGTGRHTYQCAFSINAGEFSSDDGGSIRLNIPLKTVKNEPGIWIPGAAKSTGVILSGKRTDIPDGFGGTRTASVLIDGSITFTAAVLINNL